MASSALKACFPHGFRASGPYFRLDDHRILYMGRISDDEKRRFFIRISNKCNYADPEMVKRVYYGMVKMIVERLKNEQTCWLPDLGRFWLANRKIRKVKNTFTGYEGYSGDHKSVFFLPDRKLKGYFKLLSKDSHQAAPRAPIDQEVDASDLPPLDTCSFI